MVGLAPGVGLLLVAALAVLGVRIAADAAAAAPVAMTLRRVNVGRTDMRILPRWWAERGGKGGPFAATAGR
jgi:hypothetical protein